MKKIVSLSLVALGINSTIANVVMAHCPLCVVGAGAVALGASWLGVSSLTLGIFLGAFALSIGLWFGRLIKKQLIPHQTLIIGIFSFVVTILPLQPMFFDNSAMLVSVFGDYGTWLNTTYYIDKFLVGSVLGAAVLLMTPHISKWIAKARDYKLIPYQGMVLTFVFLLIPSLLYELLLK